MAQNQAPVLYSFRRCPYAMRARMAVLQSGIHCEICEVVLRDKPAKLLEISPKGTVPVLRTVEGDVIEESLDIMMWALNQRDDAGWLSPQNASLDDALDLIRQNDTKFKHHLDRYKYPTRYDGVDAVDHKLKGQVFLADLDQRLSNTAYLFGAKISLADIAIAPFVRQFAFVDKDDFDSNSFANLQRWLADFLASSTFTRVMHKAETSIN
ncbi:MAG: glutathione S-transferase [Magnetovibrio sp.]|nr:glutathione S-transferase [Magnetovibrio sp.]